MTYTEFDIKLIRHALDTNSEGEAANAAAMFFKELRNRGVKAHEFLEDKPTGTKEFPESPYTEFNLDYKAKFTQACSELGGASIRAFNLQNELIECKKQLELARKKKGIFSIF
jgi:hypothetical protein